MGYCGKCISIIWRNKICIDMGLRSFAMDNSYRGHLLDLDQIPGKEMRLYDRFSPLVNNSKNKRQLSFCYICPNVNS